ncbi:1-acyl-sn-glycerol-3-phosphate acyltransferase [Thiocapsa roseopersicina]|uniref:1-acyl-sn-glycerol-3-phosphate acyltransferase n=2 Tax=Thiocapsa roseopersicina TaxID=1058 RepID=A0A1H2ZE09_THIRO|nr:1-acyl-sn-glycerol-3-phosphate acyltransferase [Thiocapsa roseopersicina]
MPTSRRSPTHSSMDRTIFRERLNAGLIRGVILARSLLYQVVLVGSALVYSTLLLVVGPIASDESLDRLAQSWAKLNLAALKWICGLRCRVSGLERLPVENAIVLSKHQSAWDILALRAVLPIRQSWVLKQELMRIPVFGAGLRRLQCIPIDRAAGRRAIVELVREGLRNLQGGRWVIVFPEGTRTAPGSRHPYAIGGAVLAERSGRPVVPIAHNAGFFWGRRSILKTPGTIDLVIGPTIPTVGRSAAEINAAAEEWIESTVASLPGPGAV